MRKLLSGLLTAAVLGAMAWSARDRPAADRDDGPIPAESGGPQPQAEFLATAPGRFGPDPIDGAEESVRNLLADAREGDVDAYLDAFDDDLRARLEREVAELGPEAFARQLREAAIARKSHAVFAPEPDGEGRARVTVEAVYPDRNERQTFRLRFESGRWLVAEVETVRARQPEDRVGSPASFQAPEAPPVMASPEG
ncbi:hypothetical protein [Tautonia sociabilis]|uniref:DUF3828 domain-containing protein n=1 Tax=Tautonia sociabilis TaxID=2080755 RepID=A0A432MP70_9BACT|nr:hypothetical protein [Tautonia sociabilis]RUL89202.1 hypothetical protein TsocGM_03545 [Tautonia sociabilis]